MNQTQRRRLAVLKLGGSHALGGRLGDWLEAVAAHAGRVVVVPGGGPFADVVRKTQSQIGFNDIAAHEMAMVAMSQFGRALAVLRPGFEIAATREAIEAALARGVTPIWSPERMALEARLAPSWDLTSDSLAAWLAGLLKAERVILVKHGAQAASVRELAERGLVDPLFRSYLAACGALGFLAAPEEAWRLAEGIDGDAFAAIQLDP